MFMLLSYQRNIWYTWKFDLFSATHFSSSSIQTCYDTSKKRVSRPSKLPLFHICIVYISCLCCYHISEIFDIHESLIYLQPPTFPDMNKVIQIAETTTGELFTFSVEDPSKGPDPITCSFLKTIPETEDVFYLLGMVILINRNCICVSYMIALHWFSINTQQFYF